MAAPVLRQSTTLGTALHVLGGTVTLPAWGTATLNASRIDVHLGINNFQIDGVSATAAIGTVPMTLGTTVTRQATGHDAVTTRVFYSLSTGGTVAAAKIVTSGTGTVNLEYSAHEFTGADGTVPWNAMTTGIGSGSVITLGPSATTSVSDVLWIGHVTIPNVQPLSLSGGSFTQVLAGASGAAYDQSEVTALIAKLPQTAIGSATMVSTVNANRQYAGLLYAIPAPVAGTAFGGGTGAPQQFPLGPPSMIGATTITDPDPTVRWTPTLSNTVDYILNAPVQRSKPITIAGGRNVYVPYLNIKIVGSGLGEMVSIGGGANGRITHIENAHLDPNGYEIDAFKTKTGGSGRIVQLKTIRVEKLLGQQSTVHADLFQASGGCAELWVEDFTGHTAYAGFQMQQEASLTASPHNVSNAVNSSGTVTFTTSTSHGLAVGNWVEVWGTNPGGYEGPYKVDAVPSGTTFKVRLGANSPGAYVSGGQAQQLTFPYTVGSHHFNRVNTKGYARGTAFDPAEALQTIRIGPRGSNTNSHPNEDQTPFTDEAWLGSASLGTTFYTEPPSGNVGAFVEPDSSTANWLTVRAIFHAAAGTVPAYTAWDNWSRASGKIQQGPPPLGDFVIVSGNTVIATQAGGGTPTLPAPANTTVPAITPVDPVAGGTVTTTLGVWSNVDAATQYTVNFLSSLGGTAAYGTVQTSTDTSAAVTRTYVVAGTDTGYTLKPQVIADNGSALGTALGSATNPGADDSTVTIDIVIE